MLALKSFTRSLRGTYQNNFKYPPIGEWAPPKLVELCGSGYHVADNIDDVVYYSNNQPRFRIFVVECRGDRVSTNDKTAFEQIRLVQEVNLDIITINKCKKILGFYFPSWYNKRNKVSSIFREIHNCQDNKKLAKIAKLLNIPRSILKRSVKSTCDAVNKCNRTKAARQS